VSFLFFGLCGLGAGLGAEAAGEQERALKAQRWIMPPSSPDHDALSFPGVITVFCCKSQQEEKAKAKERERERELEKRTAGDAGGAGPPPPPNVRVS